MMKYCKTLSRSTWLSAARRGSILLLLILTLVADAVPVRAQEQPPNRAGLVVVLGEGQVITRCVSFAEETITGSELVRRSGLSVVFSAYGGLGYGVCAIAGQGCGAGQDCFCQCRGADCAYWFYSHLNADGSWAVSGVGASSWTLNDGDVDGWVWGDGSTAPPALTFEDVCGSASPVEPMTDSPTPVPPVETAAPATPTPTPTPARVPSSTPSPSPPGSTATVAPSPTKTPMPTETPVPETLPSPTLAPVTQPLGDEASSSFPLAGYIVFGLIALSLLGLLVMRLVE